MRAKEFLSEQLQFTDTEGISVLDWVILREHELQGTTLFESLDTQSINYLDGLLHYSTIPIVGKQYAVISIMLMDGDRISVFGNDHILTFTGTRQEGAIAIYDFDDNGVRASYPKCRLSALSYSRVYVFSTQAAFNDFNSAIILKFNAELPKVII